MYSQRKDAGSLSNHLRMRWISRTGVRSLTAFLKQLRFCLHQQPCPFVALQAGGGVRWLADDRQLVVTPINLGGARLDHTAWTCLPLEERAIVLPKEAAVVLLEQRAVLYSSGGDSSYVARSESHCADWACLDCFKGSVLACQPPEHRSVSSW